MIASLATAPDVWTDRRWRRCALLLWLGCTAVYFLTAPGRFDLVDGAVRFEVADNWIRLGKPSVTHPRLFAVEGLNHDRYSLYPWGASVAGIPFILLGAALSGGALSTRQFAFSLTTVPYAAATVALLFMIFGRLGLSLTRALGWSLVIAFATLLWPYAGSSFDQALHCFWLTLAIWAGLEAQATKSRAWALTSGLGFFMVTALQEVYCVLVLTLLCAESSFGLRDLWQRLRTRELLFPLAGVFLSDMSLWAYNTLRFGSPFMSGRGSAPHPLIGNPLYGLPGLLISPTKSIFLYSPTVVLGVIGLIRLVRAAPSIGRVIAIVCVMHLGMISCLRFWAGEWAWGPRYLVVTVGLVSIGLPFAFAERRGRALKLALTGAGLLVQLLAISTDHQIYYIARGYRPFFWLDPRTAYAGSPLLDRPAEFAHVFSGEGLANVTALVPGPEPFRMTTAIFGPPRGFVVTDPHVWMSQYLVFQVPRPWTLWARVLPPEHRPARTDLLTVLGLLVALAAFGELTRELRRGKQRVADPVPT